MKHGLTKTWTSITKRKSFCHYVLHFSKRVILILDAQFSNIILGRIGKYLRFPNSSDDQTSFKNVRSDKNMQRLKLGRIVLLHSFTIALAAIDFLGHEPAV